MVKVQLKNLQLNSFIVLHLNFRNMKKLFEAFQDFIESLNFKFSVICLSKTCLQIHEISDSNLQLPGYSSFHLTREKGRSALYFLQETYSYEFRKEPWVNIKAFQCLCIEVENKNSIKYWAKLHLWPTKRWSQRTRQLFWKPSLEMGNFTKVYHFSWRFYQQFTKFWCNKKVQNFVNLMFFWGWFQQLINARVLLDRLPARLIISSRTLQCTLGLN